jgi:hypothetical protein
MEANNQNYLKAIEEIKKIVEEIEESIKGKKVRYDRELTIDEYIVYLRSETLNKIKKELEDLEKAIKEINLEKIEEEIKFWPSRLYGYNCSYKLLRKAFNTLVNPSPFKEDEEKKYQIKDLVEKGLAR